MRGWNQDVYTKAWNFAAQAHLGQRVPGTKLPYITHVGNVAMEAMSAVAAGEEVRDPDLMVQCALLHDVIEDTAVTAEAVARQFGDTVASGVLALSKDKALPSKVEQMEDSLRRIRSQPAEVWMVKLSDRISNLQPPPERWGREKREMYRAEAARILEALGSASRALAGRLAVKIDDYGQYL